MKNKKRHSWKKVIDFIKINKSGVNVDEILKRLEKISNTKHPRSR
jgi:hypothetical protein